ncbi:hypothetical protein [Hydrogenivirga sp.]
MERSSGVRKSSGDFSLIRRLAYGFLALALINTFANLVFSELNLKKVVQLKLASDRLTELIDVEKGKNLELRAIHARVKRNPRFYKEKFVREYLLMFKKGEKVIPLPRELWYR